MANKVWKVRNYSIEEKAAIINTILGFQKTNKWFDKGDLSYFVKMLLESGRVYVSKAAYDIIGINDNNNKRFSTRIKKMLEHGDIQSYDLQRVTHNTKKDWGDDNELIWEHVVPTNELIKLILSQKYDLQEIIQMGDVCIVTKKEDKRLVRSKMPDDWNHKDIWARYQKAKIEVVGDPFTIVEK